MPNPKYKKAVKEINTDIPANRNKALNFIVFFIVILSLLNIFLFFYDTYFSRDKGNEPLLRLDGKSSNDFLSVGNITMIAMKVPAVDDKGNGLSTYLVVEVMPGSGRTLVDIDNLLFWADTQQNIRTARRVAANMTGMDINKYDLVYSIYANATVIGGESAGAAITIATIAALENKRLNESVMITGTINHDGSIGPVGEIIAKAKAAKQSGSKLFLVPLLQSRDVLYETSQHCEKFGPTQVCTVEQVPRKISVSNQSGIEVVEVGSVQEAIKYLLI
nr:hypothetical protein [uncultured archaeon]